MFPLESSSIGSPGKPGVYLRIKIGEIMQWVAGGDFDLEVYEICYPPYREGRFENFP